MAGAHLLLLLGQRQHDVQRHSQGLGQGAHLALRTVLPGRLTCEPSKGEAFARLRILVHFVLCKQPIAGKTS